MHGANKTGKPFVGDASGDLLHTTLESLGLIGEIKITNAVKCLPIKNLPSGRETRNCSSFLIEELETHRSRPNAVVLILGGVAHRSVIASLGLRQKDYVFAHGAIHRLDTLMLVDSYHCSRYNTQTGRLTEAMFLEVMKTARDLTCR